ncbi:phage tail tape measure protein [Pseudomonas sp. ANT_J28]|uniref:phage tail tape measure protein n=1 Tax=Pseudomonas sp. ANT_J28 TaxID=2597352 RepID=UPI0011F3202E|nr:phage tail tape measure protein [Pseudomonas sp. ANT_J28]KAA0983314.1 phage tail tape measure protein [Pseudomonas sp. ANT_J28]
MSTNFTSLGIEVNSSQAVKAADDLDKLVDSAVDAEKAIDDLGKTGTGLADTGKKIVQAEREVAQEIDKSTGATQRQTDARRKSGASATSEIAIISQLDKAMSGNIGSMEQLVQAEGLLERARKGGLVTIEQQEAYHDRLGMSYDKIEKAEAKEIAQKQRLIDAESRQIEALKRTVNGIDPVTAKLAKLEAQEKAAHEAFRVGAINADRYNESLAKIGKDRAGLTEVATGFDKLKLGTRQAQENVIQLGNALSSGDWGSGVRAVAQIGAGAGASAAGLLTVLAPLALATAAVGALAVAYFKGSAEQDAFNKSLILTGSYVGTTADGLASMARQVSSTVGTTGAAAAVLAQLAGSGNIAAYSFEGITKAALTMKEATGKAVEETVAEFASIAKEPVAASIKLNEQYHYLTASVYEQVAALEKQGEQAAAVKLATDSFADAIQSRGEKITERLGLIEGAWNKVARAAKWAWDSALDVGREATYEEKLADLESQAQNAARLGAGPRGGGGRGPEQIEAEKTSLMLAEQERKNRVQARKDEQGRQESAVNGMQLIAREADSAQSQVQKLEKKLLDLDKARQKNIANKSYSPELQKQYEGAVAGVQKQIVDAKKKDAGPAGSVDLTGFNDTKNQLAAILAEYSNAQKKLEAEQKAGLISQAEYAQKRDGLIGNERDEVTAAYEAEITALESVKNKSSTTAAQRIQLDQKIADARTAMVNAQKDADSQQEVLATAETGRLDKQKYAISQYVAALGQQQKALALAGQRAVNGVGEGDRQNALNGELNSQQDRFAQQSLDLENQRSDPSRNMDPEEFKQKSKALADANKAATDQIRQNYADVEAAQGDWTKGATSAWANYLDSARDIAGQTRNLFTNAFSSMEDSIVNFAMTGKASFGDFAESILADMARIATRQASSALLGSLVGAATSYFTGSGAGNGLASGSAGAASSAAGASQAGYTGVDFSGYRATGGPVSPNSLYEVNELGPELYNEGGKSFLMTGANGGSVTPLTSGAGPGVASLGGGGATTISVQVMVAGDGSTSSTTDDPAYEQFGKDLADFVDQRYQKLVSQDLRQGGKINRAIKG